MLNLLPKRMFFLSLTCLDPFGPPSCALYSWCWICNWHYPLQPPYPDIPLSAEMSSLTIDINPCSSFFFLAMASAVHLSVLFSNNVMAYALSLMLKMDALMVCVKWLSMHLLLNISWMYNEPQRKYMPEEQELPWSGHVIALPNWCLVNSLQCNHFTMMKWK